MPRRSRPESRKVLGFSLKEGIVRATGGLDCGGGPEGPKVDGELKGVGNLISATAFPSIPEDWRTRMWTCTA